jgi:hypothetical protein
MMVTSVILRTRILRWDGLIFFQQEPRKIFSSQITPFFSNIDVRSHPPPQSPNQIAYHQHRPYDNYSPTWFGQIPTATYITILGTRDS